MGEDTTRSWRRNANQPRVIGAGDKDQAWGLLILPGIARRAIGEAARQLDMEGLILLLTKYYLKPEQICNLELEAGSLQVQGSGDVIGVTAGDWDIVLSWLSKKDRPKTPKAIRDCLRRRLQPRVRQLLADWGTTECWTSWRTYLAVGVRDLRRLAREELAEVCDYNEPIYRELLHDEFADTDQTLHFLTIRARKILNLAAEREVSLIREIQSHWTFS